ncbi:MAG: hypothetical protein ACTHJT_09195 [Cytophaga sp.]|uniref:hypothetical protein n=1 Tax=Cytophaga sp. TaxID=29535 RepID=UPI003F80E4BE
MKQLMYILKNTLAALIFLSGISAYSQTLSLFNQMNVPANPTNTYFGNICALTLDVDPATGNQIYVWSEKQTSSTDRDIYCAIYDRNSVLLIPRFKVNNGTGGDNYYQRIKIHPYDGTFIITWAGKKSGNWDIYMKSISLALNTVSSQLIMNAPDLLVNGITAGDQLTPIPTFHLGSGELLIGYTHTVAAGDRDIYYRRVNYSTMAVLGTDQSISNVTTNDQALSAMEYSSYTGEVIMFYSSTKPASTGFDCYKRILLYTAGAYSFSGTETRVNTYMTSDQTASTICINQTNGQYALSWVSLGQSSARGVYAKVFDALHTEIKAEFRISVLAADNIMNAKGIWKESTNTLVYFWTYYGSTNAIRYTQFDGNAAFAMIGGDNDALGTTNAVQGGYYTTYVPAYDAVRDVVYLSYDMYPSIGTLSSYGKVNIYRNIFDPAVSTTSNTDMNWVDVKSYDANGNVVSEGRIFYDNFGKESQSQSFNAENPTTVFASMPLYDYLDRSAIQTLPGVTNTTGALTFDPAFVKYSAGANYNPQNWDGASTTNNPDPVLTSAGLGYYYGTSNTLEAGVPNTSYPYSRTFFNDNAPGGVVKQGGLGEALRMGQNHESKSISLVVLNELDHYAKVRRGNFVVNLNAPGTLSQKATKHFVIDQNGMNGIVFTDAAGNTIATAKDGASTADPALTSTIALKPNMYYCNFPYYVSGTGWNMKYLQVFGQGNVEIINVADGTILYAMGPAVNVPEITYAGPMTTIQVRSTEPFRVKMLCTSNLPNPAPDYWARYESTYQQGQNSIDLHLQTGHALAATISNAPGATISIQDLTTGNIVYTGAASGYSYSTLAKGFYRLRFTGMNYDQDYSTNSITFSFKQSYTDWAYYFYDDAGRLIAKTAPSGITSMTNYSSPPFTGTYTYSTIGQVLSSTEVDGGTTNYVYRNDGLLRFTQNADQATDGRFSFLN